MQANPSVRVLARPLLLALGAAVLACCAAWRAAPDRSDSSQAADRSPASQPVGDPLVALSGGIVGSQHDFSARGEIARDLCLPCHTPHLTAAEAPLLVPRPTSTRPVRSYRTPAGELSQASLVCLSCHDGTVAADVYAGAHGASWSDFSAGGVSRGRTRIVNHPVGVEYPRLDPHYRSAAEVTATGRIPLPDGRIQCTTCHDPHNTGRHAGLLVISNDRSRLCLSCHRL